MATRTLVRLVLLLPVSVLLAAAPAAAQATPHAALVQAYRQSVTYLQGALQQSDRQATIDALVTAVAVSRALTDAVNVDLARLRAASQRSDIDAVDVLDLVRTAEIERTSHLLFVGNWLGADNADARQAALDGTALAISSTEAADLALRPIVQAVGAISPLPPAMVLEVKVTPQANGSFLLLADVRNVGGEAAQTVKLSLENDEVGAPPAQEVTLGTLVPGGRIQHVFALALPAGQAPGAASLVVTAANASRYAATVNLATN